MLDVRALVRKVGGCQAVHAPAALAGHVALLLALVADNVPPTVGTLLLGLLGMEKGALVAVTAISSTPVSAGHHAVRQVGINIFGGRLLLARGHGNVLTVRVDEGAVLPPNAALGRLEVPAKFGFDFTSGAIDVGKLTVLTLKAQTLVIVPATGSRPFLHVNFIKLRT